MNATARGTLSMGPPIEPRLIVTDALGQRIVPLDKPVFTIGRRSETDLRLAGADVSRVHAEIVIEQGERVLHDRQSRFGTFVNDETVDRAGAGARRPHPPRQPTTSRSCSPSARMRRRRSESAASAASELRQMAALLEGLRALGSGRVLDEVLALVLDSAIEVTGAERGFIMLANRARARSSSRSPARAEKSRCRAARSRPAARFPSRSSPPASTRSSRICWTTTSRRCTAGTVALGIRHVLCTPLRLVRYVERADDKPEDEIDRRAVSRQPRARRAADRRRAAVGARNAVAPKPPSRSRTRGSTARRSTRRSSSRSSKSPRPFSGRCCRPRASDRRVLHDAAAPRRRAWPSAATSSTTSICRRPVRVHRRRRRRARVAGRAAGGGACSACSAPESTYHSQPGGGHPAAQSRLVPSRRSRAGS